MTQRNGSTQDPVVEQSVTRQSKWSCDLSHPTLAITRLEGHREASIISAADRLIFLTQI